MTTAHVKLIDAITGEITHSKETTIVSQPAGRYKPNTWAIVEGIWYHVEKHADADLYIGWYIKAHWAPTRCLALTKTITLIPHPQHIKASPNIPGL